MIAADERLNDSPYLRHKDDHVFIIKYILYLGEVKYVFINKKWVSDPFTLVGKKELSHNDCLILIITEICWIHLVSLIKL